MLFAMSVQANAKRFSEKVRSLQLARAQLTLVEHALCPLDAERSLTPNYLHETHVRFTDRSGKRREATARVGALDGLSAHDEFYLWGLLSLALAQPEPSADLRATPYYCLRQLGVIGNGKSGGREFELFRAALKRLAGVRYQNDHFYDSVRGEHREVSFGFLNYSLPLNTDSMRAWRFAWDPIFFELASATGGALSFDLALYREFDVATRRLYLFLKKLFWRKPVTPPLELRQLAVDVLGFSPSLAANILKWKVARAAQALLDRELITLPTGITNPAELFRKRAPGDYRIEFNRGPAFDRLPTSGHTELHDSPLYEPLVAIGLDRRTISYVLTTYPRRVVEEWSDITLAARERRGMQFSKSPAAYFLDNVRAAVKGNRSAPDWWREMRKQELQQEAEQERRKQSAWDCGADIAFEDYLHSEAREAFTKAMDKLSHELRTAGQSDSEAQHHAEYHARMHFRNQFRRARRELSQDDGPASLGDLLARRPK